MRIRPIAKKTVIGIVLLLMLMAVLGLLGRIIKPHQSLREKLEASRSCRLCDLSGVDLSGADLAEFHDPDAMKESHAACSGR